MSEHDEPIADEHGDHKPVRKRPRPGERRLQILQTLATMLAERGLRPAASADLAGFFAHPVQRAPVHAVRTGGGG